MRLPDPGGGYGAAIKNGRQDERGEQARNAGPAKGRRTTKNKPRIAPTTTRAKRRSISGPSTDLKEAREQQAATAEILKVIACFADRTCSRCSRRSPQAPIVCWVVKWRLWSIALLTTSSPRGVHGWPVRGRRKLQKIAFPAASEGADTSRLGAGRQTAADPLTPKTMPIRKPSGFGRARGYRSVTCTR